MKIDLDHCVIHVANWERSNAFYQNILGAELIPRGNGFAYRLGNAQLNCHGSNVHPHPLAQIPVQPGNSDLCFIWPDKIESAIEHLKQHHIAVEVGPVPRFGSQGHGMSIYFRDPDGSLLEFISYTV